MKSKTLLVVVNKLFVFSLFSIEYKEQNTFLPVFSVALLEHRGELSNCASSHLFLVITSLIAMWKCGYIIWKRKFLHLLPTEQIDSQKGTSNALWHPHFALLPFSPKDQGAKEQRRLPLH